MKIAVVAANGRSGRAFVELALAAGHTIRAGIHGNSYMKHHRNLEMIDCDATDPAQLMNLLADQEAVVSFIGHTKGSKPDVQTVAMQELVKVMNKLSIDRIISLTGTGVRFNGDKISIVDRILNISIGIIDPKRVKDGRQHVEILKASNLNWTVIRVLKLQDIPPKPFTLSKHGPTKMYVGRQEVAQAIMQILEQGSFVKQAPIISRQKEDKVQP